MEPFKTSIQFDDVNQAVAFVHYLQGQKALNNARFKADAAAINANIDNVCLQLIQNADADSIKAFTMAQLTPPAPKVEPSRVVPPTTTPQ